MTGVRNNVGQVAGWLDWEGGPIDNAAQQINLCCLRSAVTPGLLARDVRPKTYLLDPYNSLVNSELTLSPYARRDGQAHSCKRKLGVGKTSL